MNYRKQTLFLFSALLWASITVPSAQQEPQEIGLREQTERLLIQLDVSVQGAEETISSLTRDDFELIVLGRKIDDFLVDRVCRQPTASESSEEPAVEQPLTQPAEAASAPSIPAIPITYLLYFDQSFLTQAGRIRSMEMAREMIPELVRGGNRATIVSSGRNVATYADLTDDVTELLGAVDEMEANHDQWWDPTARQEEILIADVLDTLQRRGVDEASGKAKQYQAEERWRAEKALRRFSMVVGRLADIPQPKAILYFADRMRSNPGEHYMSYFSNTQIRRDAMIRSMATDAGMARLSFDRVVNEANANGARLYTIQAEGMTGMGNIEVKSMPTTTQASSGTRHVIDAQNTLVSMAAETGGEAFLRGISAKKITRAVIEDMRCVYLVSFDAAHLPRDSAVPVVVRVHRDNVDVHHRGQVFVQSASKRLNSRLMAAFAAPDAMTSEGRVTGAVVPTGFLDGKYTAMVQLGIDGSPLPGATWDLGMSVLSRGKVREDASDRIQVSAGGTPVILEQMVTFSPGPFEIILVAHETTADEISTGRIEGTWPDPDEGPAAIGPIAMMQPARAVYLRDGQVKTSGAAGHHDVLKPDLPTAMITLICWGKQESEPLRIERQLIGDSTAEFQPMELQPDEQRCAQIRDVIRAGTMTGGEFTYDVRVYVSDAEVARGQREFIAHDGASDGSTETAAPGDGNGS